jgi:hypothetical protein
MAKRKNESQLSMVNNYWSPAILCERPLETDFVRDGFVVLESFVNKVELKKIVPLVESILTSSPELTCTRPTIFLYRYDGTTYRSAAAEIRPQSPSLDRWLTCGRS